MLNLSCEFFPPKTDKGWESFPEILQKVSILDVQFFSFTYGAGGSANRKTVKAMTLAQEHITTPLAGHLAYIQQKREKLCEVVDQYIAMAVTHIVAIRGDCSQNVSSDTYANTASFVSMIKKKSHDMRITVSGYPEVHPDSPNMEHDYHLLLQKIDAGASDIITQFCFDPFLLLQYRDILQKKGVEIPMSVGVIIPRSPEGIFRMARLCGASVPSRYQNLLEQNIMTPEICSHVALVLTMEYCTILLREGIGNIHLYTLNNWRDSLAFLTLLKNASLGEATMWHGSRESSC